MSYVYLASPYSHANPRVMQDRYERAMTALNWLINQRIWTYSPIVHCHELAGRFNLPKDIDFWASYDRAMLVPAKALIILTIDGWTISRGIDLERRIALEERIPIKYLNHDIKGYVLHEELTTWQPSKAR
jgi:hypothetical protein